MALPPPFLPDPPSPVTGPPPPGQPAGPADWPRLSPLLDELLDLPAPEREARLAALHAQAPTLTDQLRTLLARLQDMSDAGFLQVPAAPALAHAALPPGPQPGQVVGPYTLVEELGQGGMGSVWRAARSDGRYEGEVAIKFMRHGLQGRGEAQRFLREGRLLARLDHPHIARLLDAGLTVPEGQPYLLLEKVTGQPITAHCEAQGLDARARVRLMLQVLGAVAHAHSRLILHRDLKPSNILVTPQGQPKLLDFGIGSWLAGAPVEGDETHPAGDSPLEPPRPAEGEGRPPPAGGLDDAALTQRLGLRAAYTARYAAPEQLSGQEVTTATDVYALGVLLFEILSGAHPADGAAGLPPAARQAALAAVPPLLSQAVLARGQAGSARLARLMRGDLDSIVAKALQPQAAERYPNAAALAEDLQRWLNHEPVQARPHGVGYRARRFVRRHLRTVMAGAAAGTLALAVGAGLALWQAAVARAEHAQAQAERNRAETLVEFMVGDFTDKLNQLGRADLLQAVGSRALAYYQGASLQGLSDEDLARRARALALLAEAARQRMDLPEAQRGFDEAAAATAQLLAHAPGQLQRVQAHAGSLQKLQEMAVTRGDHAAALAFSRQVSTLRRRALALAPGQPELQLQAIAADQGVAYDLTRAGQPAAALQLLAQAQAEARPLPDSLPQLLRERADNQLTRGLALVALGRYAEAAQAYQNCVALLEAVPGLGSDVWQRRARGVAQRALARVRLNQGDLAQAGQLARRVLEDSLADLRAAPGNATLRQELNVTWLLLAEVLWWQGQAAAARQQLAYIDPQSPALTDVDPGHAEWHLRTRAPWLALQARSLPVPPQPGSPLFTELQALVANTAALESQGQTFLGLQLLGALQAQLALADALAVAGQPEAAARHWQAVAARAEPAARLGFPPAMQALALAWARLGRLDEARTWVARLQGTEYRHPDQAEVAQALNAARPGVARAAP